MRCALALPVRSPMGVREMNQIDFIAPTWRCATVDDLPIINGIADHVHTGLPERPEVFAEKQQLFPGGCLALQLDGNVVGYGFAHPWLLFEIPPLDVFLERLPVLPDCLYIHDVVVLPEYRGHGCAAQYVQLMVREARQRAIHALALVSVYETHPAWAKYGFAVVATKALEEKLTSYGPTAKYMVYQLNSLGG